MLNHIYPQYKHLGNLFCLICKQLVYRYKCLKQTIIFSNLVREIELIRWYELAYARKAKKLSVHNKKWVLWKRSYESQYLQDEENILSIK